MSSMTHPTQEQLQAWIDGDPDALARGDETASHIESCERCQQVLEGIEQVGLAVRLWADDAVPAPAADLADRVLALAKSEKHVVNGASASSTARANENVVSLDRARRRARVYVSAAVIIAAAAAGVFAWTQRGGVHMTPRGGGANVAANEPGGSEVLDVDSDEEHANVSVMEVPGDRAGTTVAVVWIDDESDEGSTDSNGTNAVQ
jgi:hypothetical protein